MQAVMIEWREGDKLKMSIFANHRAVFANRLVVPCLKVWELFPELRPEATRIALQWVTLGQKRFML